LIIVEKLCPRCKEVKPSSCFYHDRRGTNGLRCWCKDCISVAAKNYYKNPKAQELIKLRANQRYQDPQLKEEKRLWRKKYNQTEEGKATIFRSCYKRRSLIKNSISDLTAVQWEEIQSSQNYCCALCGEKKTLQRDHIIPASKGGAFTKSNIQGLCANCNYRKSNKMIYQPKGMTI
jgi:5-methylcytosine-specific restriction endonuclease McrA